jgi:tetratricopeptide (TPR) repeat protein
MCRAPIAAIVALAVLSPAAVAAQTHKHYIEAPQPAAPSSPGAPLAPRLQNLGPHTFPVTTTSDGAQAFINQGLNLSYGFNHAEAGRSFREAARQDPDCAMAFWGQALVLGPNINAAMDPADEPRAHEFAQKAVALKSTASAREQAYIDALARRYSGRPEDRGTRDRAYADAMRDVARRYPDDPDAAALFAESVMDLRPWGYWTKDGRPFEGIAEIRGILESAIRRHPDHPGALHFYIHLMEPTEPALAEPAADRLLTLMPAAGHMVHMPSHIYQRVGRYQDAIRANQMALQADEDYIRQCRAQGQYPMSYYPHNIHFLWWAATMDGQRALAMESARTLAARIPDEQLQQVAMLAGFRVIPYYALIRFGRWDEMLREPEPAASPFMRGIWHYGRGRAFAAKGQPAEAERSLAELRRIVSDKALDAPLFSPNTMASVLAIAPDVLAGVIAAARQDYDRAVAHLDRAVRLEDGLVYTEPAEWVYPVRHDLAAVLLRAGRPAEAETVCWEDLKRNPDNGWSLRGVADALRAQGRTEEAERAEERFKRAWARSDVALEAPANLPARDPVQ